MTRTQAIKRHLPWAAIATGLGILVSLYALDMVPWPAKASTPTKAEVTVEVSAADNAAFARDEALILRIEKSDVRVDGIEKAVDDFIGEQRKFNQRQQKRVDKVLDRVP